MYYKKACFITTWDRYYKLWHELIQNGAGNLLQRGQSLLQSGVGIIKWGNFIAKWGNYYRKGQHIFVTLGQIEIHIYQQGQCGLRTES